MYKTQIIYYNITIHGTYTGRFMIENAYRPFRDSDYALVEWFGEYVKLLLNKTRHFHFAAPREFESMIEEISIAGAEYRKEYDSILTDFGWKPEDRFVCHAITLLSSQAEDEDKRLNDAAFYLE